MQTGEMLCGLHSPMLQINANNVAYTLWLFPTCGVSSPLNVDFNVARSELTSSFESTLLYKHFLLAKSITCGITLITRAIYDASTTFRKQICFSTEECSQHKQYIQHHIMEPTPCMYVRKLLVTFQQLKPLIEFYKAKKCTWTFCNSEKVGFSTLKCQDSHWEALADLHSAERNMGWM